MSDFDHTIPTKMIILIRLTNNLMRKMYSAQRSVLIHKAQKRFTRILTNIGAMMTPSMM